MKSITIHSLDDALDVLIREKAKAEGTSLNKTIKRLLAEALGLQQEEPGDHRQDFLDLHGTWTKDEARRFGGRIKDLGKVDPEDWK